MDERELARRAQGGDRCAFATLLRRYQEVAFRAAYLVTTNATEAEDALQDGFINAFQALRSFDPNRPFRPWLLRIVTNAARNRSRSASRQQRLRLRIVEPEREHGASPESEVIAAQQREAIMHALTELPEADRLALTYRYFLDLSVGEIAQLFDCPASTMRSRLLRARGRLRDRLLQADSEPGSSETEEGQLQ